jgi:ADP-ribose pyrophosphatase
MDGHMRITGRETLVHGSRFDFEQVEVTAPDGSVHARQHLRHPGAVCVLPVRETERGQVIVCVRNYRAALDAWVLEIPAGTLEAGEDPAACAARELVEETGYQAATIEPLGRFHTSPGLSDELMWAYLAFGLSFVGQSLDEGEHLTVEEVPLARAITGATDGLFTDGKSMLTILLARARGGLNRWLENPPR